MSPIIGVIGGSQVDEETAAVAETVGREVAKAGALLICGGMGGVMEAACRGAKDEGGTTLGILPGESADEANAYVDIPVVTGLRQARNVIIARTAHALIAVDGSHGTLSEIAYGLHFGKRVVGLSTWALSPHGSSDDPVLRASSAEEAVCLALQD